jgi:Hemerythrin HHE cation binding domain
MPGDEASQLTIQHELLRGLTVELVQAARTILADGTALLARYAGQIADVLEEHERLEARVLAPMSQALRVAEMQRTHHREHQAFVAELRLIASERQASVELEAQVFELAAELYRHIDREEIEYLNAAIVRESIT